MRQGQVDGDTLLLRRAEGRDEVQHLQREAELLTVARHPGVVELVGLTVDGATAEMRTAIVGRPLSERLPLPAVELAGVVAVVATTLADLHAMGVVHGAVDADHVMIGDGGRPVLGGFERGGRTGDVATDGTGAPRPQDDVADLGRLLAVALGLPEPPADAWLDLRSRLAARPVQSWRARILRARAPSTASGSEPAAAALADLAREATDPDAARRPTAAAFASAVHDRVPLARLPRPEPAGSNETHRASAEETHPPDHRPPLRVVGLVAGAALVLILAALVATGTGDAGRTDAPSGPSPAAPRPAPPDVASPTPPSMAVRVWPTTTTDPPPVCPAVDQPLRADVDGDGCAEALTWSAGVLSAGSARFALGLDGDLAVTGDWDCDGRATLALLRPGVGDVFVFDGWASAASELAARRVGKVEEASTIETGRGQGGGCDEIVVRRADGSSQTVPGGRR